MSELHTISFVWGFSPVGFAELVKRASTAGLCSSLRANCPYERLAVFDLQQARHGGDDAQLSRVTDTLG